MGISKSVLLHYFLLELPDQVFFNHELQAVLDPLDEVGVKLCRIVLVKHVENRTNDTVTPAHERDQLPLQLRFALVLLQGPQWVEIFEQFCLLLSLRLGFGLYSQAATLHLLHDILNIDRLVLIVNLFGLLILRSCLSLALLRLWLSIWVFASIVLHLLRCLERVLWLGPLCFSLLGSLRLDNLLCLNLHHHSVQVLLIAAVVAGSVALDAIVALIHLDRVDDHLGTIDV